MANYMRFIVTDGELSMAEIEQALAAVDEGYRLQLHGDQRHHSADLHHGDRLLGEIEINNPGDELFEDEMDELLATVDTAEEGEALALVTATLGDATGMVAFNSLATEEVSLDTLWRWLHQNREGLLQTDGVGYYDVDGLLLRVE